MLVSAYEEDEEVSAALAAEEEVEEVAAARNGETGGGVEADCDGRRRRPADNDCARRLCRLGAPS